MSTIALQPPSLPALPGRRPIPLAAPAVPAAPGARVETARESATGLVSVGLVQPLLAMARESMDEDGLFAPGSAERRFAPMLDRHLAESITGAANLPLVDVIADRLAGDAPVRPSPLQRGPMALPGGDAPLIPLSRRSPSAAPIPLQRGVLA